MNNILACFIVAILATYGFRVYTLTKYFVDNKYEVVDMNLKYICGFKNSWHCERIVEMKFGETEFYID